MFILGRTNVILPCYALCDRLDAFPTVSRPAASRSRSRRIGRLPRICVYLISKILTILFRFTSTNSMK